MKKKTAISLILSLVLILMAGCGEDGTMTSDVTTQSTDTGSQKEESETSAKKSKGGSKEEQTEDAEEEEEEKNGLNEDDRLRLVNTYFDLSKQTETGGYTYFQSFGNHIMCTLSTENKYPKLAKELREIGDAEEDFFRDEIKNADREAFEYEESLRSSGNTGYYYHYADDDLKRADEKCVSIVRILSGYLGGAHPDYYYETFNIDPSTGKEIALSDVIKDEAKMREILEQKLLADYPDVEYFGLTESLEEYDFKLTEDKDEEDSKYAYDYTFDPDGVSFYFSPYGISAYAYGDQVVKILYDEEPDLFKKDMSYDGGYISYLTDMENEYGLGGTAELLSIDRTDYDENNFFQNIDVYKGKSKLSIGDTYYYSMTAFTAHTGDDKDFLYILANMENDYKELFAVDLNGGALKQVELDSDMDYCFAEYYDEPNGVYGVMLPLYPDDLDLGIRCDLLSTYTANGTFEVEDSGELKLKDKYLTVPEGVYVLTSKMDMKADIVDEAGSVKEKDAEIEKGTEFTLYRTDGKSIVDAKLSDGRIVRFNVSSEYPHKVNDTYNEESLFDGLLYAG